jgi:hypothetical protein
VNTRALNALAGVICRAQEQDRTPMGIAFAVDAAGMHMSPETAVELEQLRARVAELEQLLADAPVAVTLTERASEAADKLTRLFAPTQALREDPHDGPLHHSYRVPRDLPETGGV